MTSRNTKLAIAHAYVRLTEQAGSRRVSVVDVARLVGCERKTFYRHFDDTDDLVIWFYRDAIRSIVLERFPDAVHVRPDTSLADKYAEWPFYARIYDGEGGLAEGPYFKAQAEHFDSYRPYYANVFRQQTDKTAYRCLLGYMRKLFMPALADDAAYLLHGRIVSREHILFLADYHASGLMERLYQFVCNKDRPMLSEDDLHWNYVHVAMARDLSGYFAQPAAMPRHRAEASNGRR